jgi:hypothetical protein
MKGCSVPNCKNVHYARGFCQNHYIQARVRGELKTAPRTRYTKENKSAVDTVLSTLENRLTILAHDVKMLRKALHIKNFSMLSFQEMAKRKQDIEETYFPHVSEKEEPVTVIHAGTKVCPKCKEVVETLLKPLDQDDGLCVNCLKKKGDANEMSNMQRRDDSSN